MDQAGNKLLYIETFGCQMNFLDSELVASLFERQGWRRTDQRAQADAILINTCSVRDHAEQRVLSRLGHLRRLKAVRPELIVGVIGCQAQRQGRELLARFGHLDVVCGPGELDRLPELVRAASESSRTRPNPIDGACEEASGRTGKTSSGATAQSFGRKIDPARMEALETLDLGRTAGDGPAPFQAYVRVQRGCDRFCAYCIVPMVRGSEQSRPPANVTEECRRLAEAGCREITLLGQTVSNYRHDDPAAKPIGLARLLEQVAAIKGLVRVRFVTSYPGSFDEDIFRVMADVEKVCPYLHIPAQSGSDRMLKAMRRGYTADDYYRLIDAGRRIVPNLSPAGDFIVGFPGETDEDFAATVEMARRVRYKNCFVFKYSPRPGTYAAKLLPDDVPDEVKRRRNNELLAIQAEISLELNRAMVGSRVQVLVEGLSKMAKPANGATTPLQMTGRTPGDHIVVFDRPAGTPASDLVGRLVDVEIAAATPYTLLGKPL